MGSETFTLFDTARWVIYLLVMKKQAVFQMSD
jgi:hypothetical protein